MDESIRIVGIIEYSRKSLSSFHVGFVEGCGTRVSRFVHKFYRVQLCRVPIATTVVRVSHSGGSCIDFTTLL